MIISKDYSGEKYGSLTLIKEVEPYTPPDESYKSRKYLCKCDCGNQTEVVLSALRNGNTKSCGCLNRGKIIERNKKKAKFTGYNEQPHFSRWKGMVERCYYPNHKDYHRYGGRGVTVHEDWKDHPKKFIEWIENESNWQDGKSLSLDRKDYNGNYEPDNCTFVDKYTQARNRDFSNMSPSGHAGVSKLGDKWRSRITVNGKRISLGVFDDKAEAIKSRKKAEKEYFS